MAPTLVAGVPVPTTDVERQHVARAAGSIPDLPIGTMVKRATDAGTAGGNAFSGNSNDASGGSVGNQSTGTTAQSNTGSSKFCENILN